MGTPDSHFLQWLSGGKTGSVFFHDKSRDPSMFKIFVRLGIDHSHIGYRAVCNEHFTAVKDIAPVFLYRPRGHGSHVGSGAWLGQAHAAYPFAGCQSRHIFFP